MRRGCYSLAVLDMKLFFSTAESLLLRWCTKQAQLLRLNKLSVFHCSEMSTGNQGPAPVRLIGELIIKFFCASY